MEIVMEITKAKYRNTVVGADMTLKTIVATIDGIEMYVPLDPANIHYAEILKQVDAGTLTIEDAD